MHNKGKHTIQGQITGIYNGETRISRSYIYGYMVLSVLTKEGLYSVLVHSAKINKYGFLPRVGQRIRAEGIRTPARDGYYDYSMSHLAKLEHIEPTASQSNINRNV